MDKNYDLQTKNEFDKLDTRIIATFEILMKRLDEIEKEIKQLRKR